MVLESVIWWLNLSAPEAVVTGASETSTPYFNKTKPARHQPSKDKGQWRLPAYYKGHDYHLLDLDWVSGLNPSFCLLVIAALKKTPDTSILLLCRLVVGAM